MTDLFEISGQSLKAAASGTFKNPGAWILMAVLTGIVCYILGLFSMQLDAAAPEINTPLGIGLIVVCVLLSFILHGAYVKALRLEKPDFKHFGKTFGNGFLLTVLSLIYTIVPVLLGIFIIAGVSSWAVLLPTGGDTIVYILAIVVCWVLIAAIYILANILWMPAVVQFARTGKLSAGLALTDLMDRIQTVTWSKCILGALLIVFYQIVLFVLIIGIAYMFTLIPVAGDILGVVFAALFIPFGMIFCCDYFARLFKEA